jgi:hypothetical protein
MKTERIREKSFSIPTTKANTVKKTINGFYYGSGDVAVIFSNMDTNDQTEWDPIINNLISDRYFGVTYTYTEHADDQSWALEEVISFVCGMGVKKIVLIGASRGGVASIKVAARNVNNNRIAGVVSISAPIEYEGTIFYSLEELSGIRIPKLLLNSEGDGGADDNRKMIEIFREPKELYFYPGDSHGTELFVNELESITDKIVSFIISSTGE